MLCDACNGKGYLVALPESKPPQEIQRCDACEQFESDQAATQYVLEQVFRLGNIGTIGDLLERTQDLLTGYINHEDIEMCSFAELLVDIELQLAL